MTYGTSVIVDPGEIQVSHANGLDRIPKQGFVDVRHGPPRNYSVIEQAFAACAAGSGCRGLRQSPRTCRRKSARSLRVLLTQLQVSQLGPLSRFDVGTMPA